MNTEKKLKGLEKFNKKLFATSNTLGSLGLKLVVAGSGLILLGWVICPWVGHNDKKIGKLKRDIKHGH